MPTSVALTAFVGGTQIEFLDHVSQPVDRSEVLRYLGYPGDRRPAAAMQATIDRWINVGIELAEPRAVIRTLPVVDQRARKLTVATGDREATFHGAIGAFLGNAELLLVFIATAGDRLEQVASEKLSNGDDLAALVLGAVGSERAEAAELAALDRIRQRVEHAGFGLTLPYSPGYCGMEITQQQTLFSLFGNQTCGVQLTDACMMQPVKSISGLVGIGPKSVIAKEQTPCERCELKGCNMRRD